MSSRRPHPRAREPLRAAAACWLALLALVLAACGSPAPTGPSPSTTPSASASGPAGSASPPAGGIEHPTGATDIVLRVRVDGGFVAIEEAAGRVPVFTLYGDGRVIVQGPRDAAGLAPLREARLDEAGMQALLAFALGPGGLGIARESYETGGFLDAPTTVFELEAGGLRKVVRVLALGAEPQPGPDAPALAAFAALLERLQAIATGVAYEPVGVVAVLVESEPDPVRPPIGWPFRDLLPEDVPAPAADDPLPFPHVALTPGQVADAAEAGIDAPDAGFAAQAVTAPDGRTYLLILRPQLPDEAPPAP